MVELVRLYSKQEAEAARLRSRGARHHRRDQLNARIVSRQRQRRLSVTDVPELIKEYESQVPVKDPAQEVWRPSPDCHRSRAAAWCGAASSWTRTGGHHHCRSLIRSGLVAGEARREVQRGLHDCMASPASRWSRNAVVEPTSLAHAGRSGLSICVPSLSDGWSIARLSERYGVDTTISVLAWVGMQSSHERGAR